MKEIKLVIVLGADGRLNVTGPLADLKLCVRLLAGALQAVADHRNGPEILLAPAPPAKLVKG